MLVQSPVPEAHDKVLDNSRSNWNLEMLVFEERGKPKYLEKNPSEQEREPTTNSTHIWHRVQESNLGHIGGSASALTTAPSLLSGKVHNEKITAGKKGIQSNPCLSSHLLSDTSHKLTVTCHSWVKNNYDTISICKQLCLLSSHFFSDLVQFSFTANKYK